jgi:hypothetical protein
MGDHCRKKVSDGKLSARSGDEGHWVRFVSVAPVEIAHFPARCAQTRFSLGFD